MTTWLGLLALLAIFAAQPSVTQAQGTAFSYQGRLNCEGVPVNGLYDFQFTLTDAAVEGNIVSGPVTNSATAVNNGLFSVSVDFGAGAFNGQTRWLDIMVRSNSAEPFTPLLPREEVLSTPYAIVAGTASNLLGTISAAQITGSLAATQISGTIRVEQLPGEVLTNNGAGVNLSGTFSGDGAGLTNLPSAGGLVWRVPAGTVEQAQPNTGYLITNASQTTVTLPTNLNIGDVVRVAGIGAGGWRIAQNAGQYVQAGVFEVAYTDWSTLNTWVLRSSAGGGYWHSIAASADGMKMIACQNGGYIFTSTNGGTNWVQRPSAGGGPWSSVACSADGVKLVACQAGGYIYTSADSGANWVPRVGGYWSGVALSADGTKLVACQNGGYIYTSSDSGANWVGRPSAGGGSWYSVASSADGSKIVACQNGGYVFTSADSGTNWVVRSSAGGGYWTCVASSADGTKLIAGQDGYLFTSSDSGVSWTVRSSAGGGNWRSIACSTDGTKVAAVCIGGPISTSADSGMTWSIRNGSGPWKGIASSSDGRRLAVAQNGGYIYTAEAATAVRNTSTPGTTGGIIGDANAAIELIYVGNGQFAGLNPNGTLTVE